MAIPPNSLEQPKQTSLALQNKRNIEGEKHQNIKDSSRQAQWNFFQSIRIMPKHEMFKVSLEKLAKLEFYTDI